MMSHPAQTEQQVSGLTLFAKSFKTNLVVYRSIGGTAEVRKKKQRRWWCLWLCKTWEHADAKSIIVSNTYYVDENGIPVPADTKRRFCGSCGKLTLKEWAVGGNITVGGGERPKPTPLPDLLIVEGVKTEVEIVLKDGSSAKLTTAKGPHF